MAAKTPSSEPAKQIHYLAVFGDQAVAAAMIDRIVHHADVLTLKGASYRLRNRGIDTLPSIRIRAGTDQPDT